MYDDDIPELDATSPGPERSSGPPLTVRVFGVFFALIGVLFAIGIVSMRSGPGKPSLPFVGVGILICSAFVFLGIMVAIGRAGRRTASSSSSKHPDMSAPGTYACPSCGAALGPDADVSPHGDVRCGYCERWFNIHGRGP